MEFAVFFLDFIIEMLPVVIVIAFVVIQLIISIVGKTGNTIAAMFLQHINWLDSGALAIATYLIIYCANRFYDLKSYISFGFEAQPHIVFCIIAAIGIMVLTLFLQTTKIGFWIFTVIFSILWALALAGIIYWFSHDKIWFVAIFICSTIVNFLSHLSSRTLRFRDIAYVGLKSSADLNQQQ